MIPTRPVAFFGQNPPNSGEFCDVSSRSEASSPGRKKRAIWVRAGELMADIAVVLIDTGVRPRRNSQLHWEYVSWTKGQLGPTGPKALGEGPGYTYRKNVILRVGKARVSETWTRALLEVCISEHTLDHGRTDNLHGISGRAGEDHQIYILRS